MKDKSTDMRKQDGTYHRPSKLDRTNSCGGGVIHVLEQSANPQDAVSSGTEKELEDDGITASAET